MAYFTCLLRDFFSTSFKRYNVTKKVNSCGMMRAYSFITVVLWNAEGIN